MQKWEYLTASFNSNDAYRDGAKLYEVPAGHAIGTNWNEALNSLGESGWELVCTGAEQLIFKRPKE